MNHHTTGRRRVGLVLITLVVLVLALGGTAIAGKLVTGKQIKDRSVTGVDLRDATLRGNDIANGSLTAADVGTRIAGAVGPSGPDGAEGPQGQPGVDGVHGLLYVMKEFSVATGGGTGWTADCPSGHQVVGGGGSSSNPANTRVIASVPKTDGTGWLVHLDNVGATQVAGYVWATCAILG